MKPLVFLSSSAILILVTISCTSLIQPPNSPQDLSVFSPIPRAEFIDYIRAENKFADTTISSVRALETDLTAEIFAAANAPENSEAISYGSFEYLTRDEIGRRHPVIYRRRTGQSREYVAFDPNLVFESYPQATLGLIRIGPSHSAIAVSVDLQHSGKFALLLWHVESAQVTLVSEQDIQDVEFGADDNRLFFTTRERGRAAVLSFWQQGKESRTLFNETDESRTLSLRRSKAGTNLSLISDSDAGTRFFAVAESNGAVLPVRLHSFPASARFVVTPLPQGWIVKREDGTIYRLDRGQNSPKKLSLSPDRLVEDLDVFSNGIVLLERYRGKPALQIVRGNSDAVIEVPLPGAATQLKKLSTPDYNSPFMRVALQSLAFPQQSAKIDLQRAEFQPSAEDFSPKFTVEQVSVSMDDGQRVPVTIVGAPSLNRGAPAPLLLTGYGAYGATASENFSPFYASLMRRGFRIAVAHVRGEGYLGPAWSNQGRRTNKKRSFEDFVASAKYLISRGYADPDRLFAYGKSAGGLLAAVSAGTHPKLFRSIVLDRPLVDVIAGIDGADALLQQRERQEWGDPDVPAERAYIESYSPFQQIAKYSYPPMLVITSLRDTVVPYWDVARWFAVLREKDRRNEKLDPSEKLLWTSMTATHESEVDAYAQAKLEAKMAAFLIQSLTP